MLALVVLGLIACESASSFKFNRVTENHDRVIYYPNIEPSNNNDYNLVILNEQKKNINIKKKYLDINIENIYTQKEDLDREIEKIDRKKEYLDIEIEKFDRQKDNLDRETDIIYKKIDYFDKRIDYLNNQKDQLDNEIDKIDLEVDNIDSDRDRYNIHRAAIEDNEYRIIINMPGYNENEIIVKSGKGRLVVQALHDILGEPKRSFQNIRNLPDFVTENGSWSYKWGVLRVVFPVIQRTRYETNNVIYRNGVIGNSDLEKKYSISSTGKTVLPTTYVSKYDVKATTQVTSQGDDIVTNINSKSEEGKPTTSYTSSQKETIEKTTELEPTYSSSQKNKAETTIYLKPISQRDDVESTVSVTKQIDDSEVTTSIPTYVTKKNDVGVGVTSIYNPDQDASTYSVSANDDIFLMPVVY